MDDVNTYFQHAQASWGGVTTVKVNIHEVKIQHPFDDDTSVEIESLWVLPTTSTLLYVSLRSSLFTPTPAERHGTSRREFLLRRLPDCTSEG